MNVDEDLEDLRWVHVLGGERLPAASYALLQNCKNGLFFTMEEGSRILALVCYQLHSSGQMFWYQTPGRRPPPITYHLPCCEHCDQRVCWSSYRARPVQDWWRCRWFRRSMSVEDSESRRFGLNDWLSFSQADLGPTSGQEWYFSFFFWKFGTFFCQELS